MIRIRGCKSAQLQAEQLIKDLCAEGLDPLMRLCSAARNSRRKMPPRALKRTVRKISDEEAGEKCRKLLRELGQQNAEIDGDAAGYDDPLC